MVCLCKGLLCALLSSKCKADSFHLRQEEVRAWVSSYEQDFDSRRTAHYLVHGSVRRSWPGRASRRRLHDGDSLAGGAPAEPKEESDDTNEPMPQLDGENLMWYTAFTSISLLLMIFTMLLKRVYMRWRGIEPGERVVASAPSVSGGLSNDEIARLPRTVYMRNNSAPVSVTDLSTVDLDLDAEVDTCCSICLMDYENGIELLHLVPCGHEFHLDCGGTWLKRKNTCPLCKQVVKREPTISEQEESV
jgi:hypothetical protein